MSAGMTRDLVERTAVLLLEIPESELFAHIGEYLEITDGGAPIAHLKIDEEFIGSVRALRRSDERLREAQLDLELALERQSRVLIPQVCVSIGMMAAAIACAIMDLSVLLTLSFAISAGLGSAGVFGVEDNDG